MLCCKCIDEYVWDRKSMCDMSVKIISKYYEDVLVEWFGILTIPLSRRHNGRDGISNHRRFDCLLNRLFSRRSKKTSKFRVTGFCEGNSLMTGQFPSQRASNAENVSIWWRHHVASIPNECKYREHTTTHVFRRRWNRWFGREMMGFLIILYYSVLYVCLISQHDMIHPQASL